MGALALVMKDAVWQIPVVVASFKNTVREINVLAIHKEVFVKESHFVEYAAAQEAVGSAHNIYFNRLIPGETTHIILPKLAVAREILAQTYHLVERCHGGGQSATRLHRACSVALEHLHAQTAGIRMGVHEGETVPDSVLSHYSIGIEEQHIVARTLLYGDIVGPRKTKIVGGSDELHFGKTLFKILYRVVARMVIDDKNFGFDTVETAPEGIKTLFEVVSYIIAYYDNT